MFFKNDLELHAREAAESESEGSDSVEETCARETEGGEEPNVRAGELVGEAADQKELQSEFVEPVWNELQDAVVKSDGVGPNDLASKG